MGKTFAFSLNERHPTLSTNHKKDKNKLKKYAKTTSHNAEVKVQMKRDLLNAKKKIAKSRATKRRLKAKESGIRTAKEEKDASQLADYADQLIYEERKVNLNKAGTGKIQLNHWDDWDDILLITDE